MKAFNKIKALPYTSFPPISSSNNNMGGEVFACDSENHYANTYFVFRPSGTAQINDLGSFIIWYHPSPVNYTELNMRIGFTSDITGDIQGSNDGSNWVTISSYSISSDNTTIQLSYSDYYKYYKMTISSVSNNSIGFSNPVGTYLWYMATLNPDSSQVGNSLSTIKNVERKYFKYSYSAFVQPALTSDGRLGGDGFAIEGSNYLSSYYPWHAFDQSTRYTSWIPYARYNDTNPEYMIMYNLKPLNVTNITVKNGSANDTAWVSGDIQYSNDGVTWTNGVSWTNSNQTGGATWSIDLSSNTNYYNYYKINISEWKHRSTYARAVEEITLTATERSIVSGNASDYDYYLDLDTYKVLVG